MKVKILIAFLLLASTFSACKKSTPQTETKEIRLIVSHYQRTVMANGPWLAYVAQIGSDIGTGSWGNLFENIDGFIYEPGYMYDLNVIVQTFPNPSGNGTSTIVELKTINNKVKVADDTSFEIYLTLNQINFVTGNANTGFKILDKINIDGGTLLNDLTQALASSPSEIVGKFVHNPDGSYLLKELRTK
jgi:hypothetical protein